MSDGIALGSLAPCVVPLAGTKAGSDARAHPAHERVRAEIAKLVAGEAPSWPSVEADGCALLRETSKDLQIASYVAAAALETRGARGLAEGLSLLATLVLTFGDALWPERPRARTSALEWLSVRAGERLSSLSEIAATERTALEDALALLRTALTSTGVLSADLSQLARAIESSASVPSTPVTGAPARAEPALPGRTSIETPQTAARPRSEPSATLEPARDVATVAAQLIALARERREAAPCAPEPYAWLRQALGLRIVVPPADERGLTRIAVPPRATRMLVQSAEARSDWHQVLQRTEALLADDPLWLDGHRITAHALSQLGDEGALAHTVVERESRVLLQRLPALAQLSFRDGTPLGSPETLAWLMPPRAAAPSPSASEPPVVDEALVARAVQGERSAYDAIEAQLGAARSVRNAFRLRLALADALARAGRTAPALALLRGLEGDLDAHALERWEPALAIASLTTFSRTLSAARVDTAAVELERVQARLARLTVAPLLSALHTQSEESPR